MPQEITLKLPDGSARSYPEGATGLDVAQSIGSRLAKAALIAKADGVELDLYRTLSDGSLVEIVTPESDDGRKVIRHSTAHVMAQAVLQLWPGAKFAIGP